MARYFEMSDEEKLKIRKQHEDATKSINDRKEELKKGLQKPKEEKKEEKKTP